MQLTRRTVVAGLTLSGCAPTLMDQRIVSIRTPDDVLVSGREYGNGRRGVVLVPGGHGVGETWDLQAHRLAEAGFRVLAMDYRGRGVAPTASPDDTKAHLDVLGAVRQLRAGGVDHVSVVGASWGGWAAGTAAVAEPSLIDRLVLLAHSPFEQPERLGGRKLFIVAAEDRVGSGRLRLHEIRSQYDRAPEPKQLVVLPGAAHAQFLFLTPHGETLYAEIFGFLAAP
ncbi:MAG TPA: alpha/beta fold hydrolase [Allosphingosinicella sp.]